MIQAALALSVFMVIVGIGQMFVITLGPGNVDLSLPANIGLASAVAMKVMDGSDAMILVGIAAALASGTAIGLANYLLIWALRIPPIIATLSASFIIQSIDISYGRGLQIKPPPGFAAFTNYAGARHSDPRHPDRASSRPRWGSCCTARSTAAPCSPSARTCAPRGSPTSRSAAIRLITYVLSRLSRRPERGASRRLFPRRLGRHRQRIPARLDRRRRDRRHLGRRRQGQRARASGARRFSWCCSSPC